MLNKGASVRLRVGLPVDRTLIAGRSRRSRRCGLPSLLTRSDTVTVFVAAYPSPGSVHFFMPDRDTSPHPLIIAAGMDGTGLLSLSRALSYLGRRVSLPGNKAR